MNFRDSIRKNLDKTLERIARAAERSGRAAGDVKLVAVTKTRSLEKIEVLLECGQRILGENRVQEALPKIEYLKGRAEWHLIGHLQTNKARFIPGAFAAVHSVDSIKVLQALEAAGARAQTAIRALVQVNASHEAQKSGCEMDEALGLFQAAKDLRWVQVEGLMTMAALAGDPEEARPAFAELRKLKEELLAGGVPEALLRELSMGMSHDFEVAIEEGATLVRVGSALFQD